VAETRDLGRLLTAMVTPFDGDGRVDHGRAEELAAYLVASGNDGVVVCGTTGESPTLTHEEKLELLRAVRGAVPEATVVMGAGTNDTVSSVALGREALHAGADVVMAVCPYYNRPPQKSLYAHFKAIADGIGGPLLLYNVPSRTASNLAAETAIRLSQVDNIIALKEASPDLSQASAVCAGASPGFRVYSGDDSLTLPMMAVGAHGVVSVAGHFAAPGIRAMIEYFVMGDTRRARELHHRLTPIFTEIFCTTSPVPAKALFRALGMDLGVTRLPLVMDELSEAQLETLVRTARGLGELGGPLSNAGAVAAPSPVPA
jgi:4-hydroxy-tetrahydrodipicolinate synthase